MRPDRPGALQPMKARVIVTLKSGALRGLAIDGLKSVRQGKIFDIEIDGEDHAAARRRLAEACERLLANTIVENYAIEIG
jgi:phosphoribosylformylglycinamidine synthase